MQFGVYRNAGETSDYAPYLLDVQANLLDDLDTRVVVPLVKAALFGRRAGRLHPSFTLDGETLIAATHLIAAIRRVELGERLFRLEEQRDAVVMAMDVLLSGV
ncbi:MAG TPA: CcdB family protein [Acetobacteraceae bacterium]